MTEKRAGFSAQKCTEPDVGDLFAFYINGNVTEDQRETIEKHLAVCPECREELRFYLATQTVRRRARQHKKAPEP